VLSSTPTFPRRVPLVAVVCALAFGLYVLVATGQQTILCDRTAEGTLQCEARQSLVLGQWSWSARQFPLKGVEIDSELCDNVPQGGVRFCHRITLRAPDRRYTLPPFRSPLSSAALRDRFDQLGAGQLEDPLTFRATRIGRTYWRTGLMAVLLGVVAWGFWDVPSIAPESPDED